jgi:hypothetical protein
VFPMSSESFVEVENTFREMLARGYIVGTSSSLSDDVC